MKACSCDASSHETKLVVLTGGPGAGKTAVLELIKQHFCEHVAVLPEAASIIFGGGFWRLPSESAKRAAQRAIFHVQREQERLMLEEKRFAVGLCDRGTVDGLAYWPGSPEEYWRQLGTSQASELARYAAVIHLRSPKAEGGYNHVNPVRVETAQQAAEIDSRLEAAWRLHPKHRIVDSRTDFLEKARIALDLIREEMPECCRRHSVPSLK